MSRGFYHVVFCAFARRESEGTLIVMLKAGFTRFASDQGKFRECSPVNPLHFREHVTLWEGSFLPRFTRSGYARGTPLIDPRCLQGTAKRARIYDPFFLSV